MKYLLYGNGDSANHGCEAIFRGTAEILNERYIIQSASVTSDEKYELSSIADLNEAKSNNKRKLDFIKAYIKLKLTGKFTDMDGIFYLPAIKSMKGKAKIALSVGGDNYCYSDPYIYGYLNKAYRECNFKTVLWGCSVEPEVTKIKSVAKDLADYNLIVARESISYEALKQVNDNTFLAPDPAFFMKPIETELSEIFNKPTIGINVSPMIISNEQSKGMTYENYSNLGKYILNNTDYNIALIPHVVWDSNDDRTILKRLYDDFDNHKRIALIEDHTAPKLKYIISKCELFVGARTHATIAAYSSCVPTLVVGYSVKARGIAKDLFGSENKYLLSVQSLNNPNQLLQEFKKLINDKEKVHNHLMNFLPDYKQKMNKVKEALNNL